MLLQVLIDEASAVAGTTQAGNLAVLLFEG